MNTPRTLGRYALYDALASGGMATVHLGRLLGPAGFSRTVAIKRLHENYARDPEFVSMFLDEARLAARIRHPNVAATLDVVASAGELFLVMEYVEGESLGRLMLTTWAHEEGVPARIASAIMCGVLAGLHAAHEATSEDRAPLGIIHRDVSPQNILIGVDGVPRVVDFGVAKAAGRMQTTRDGQLKGKLSYMPPEQIRGDKLDRRVDVYGVSVVLWEALVGRKLFKGEDAQVMFQVLDSEVEAPSKFAADVPPELDAVVLKGLSKSPDSRFESALEMAKALETAVAPATTRELAEWLNLTAGDALETRAALLADVEKSTKRPVPVGGPSSRSLLESEPTTHPARSSKRLPRRRMPLLYVGAAIAGGLAAAAFALRPSDAEGPRPVSLEKSVELDSPSSEDVDGAARAAQTAEADQAVEPDASGTPSPSTDASIAAPQPKVGSAATAQPRGLPRAATTAVPSAVETKSAKSAKSDGPARSESEPDYGF